MNSMLQKNQAMEQLIDINQVINYLKQNLQWRKVCQNILHQKIIHEATEYRKVTVAPNEIQAEADRQRRQNQLEKSSDTLAWLANEMIKPDDWEAGIYENLLRKKLAEYLFAEEVDKYFAQNRLDFEQVLLYQILVPDKKLAWEIFYQIEEEEISFFQAAHLYDISEQRRHYCGYEGKLFRHQISSDFSAVIFAAKIGKITQPLKTDQGYHLFLIEEFIEAKLTLEIYQEVIDKMFEQWLVSETNYKLYNSGE